MPELPNTLDREADGEEPDTALNHGLHPDFKTRDNVEPIDDEEDDKDDEGTAA